MIILITVIFIVGFIWLCALRRSQSLSKEYIVYVAHASKKYHLKDCHFILDEAIPISEKKAIEKGYKPCKSCNPNFGNS